jgi:hypothetical protein
MINTKGIAEYTQRSDVCSLLKKKASLLVNFKGLSSKGTIFHCRAGNLVSIRTFKIKRFIRRDEQIVE